MNTTRPSRSRWLRKVTLSPWVIVAVAAIGVTLGIIRPELARAMAPVGELYLHLLEMCVLPIVLSAIALNMGRILATSGERGRIGLLAGLALSFFLAAAVLGLAGGLIGQPGVLDSESRDTLGYAVQQSGFARDLEIAMEGPYTEEVSTNATISFLERLIPQNVFQALSEGNVLKVLFFAVLFGLALGFAPDANSGRMFEVLEEIYRAFSNLITWFTFALPLALPFIIAPQVQQAGTKVIWVMTDFLAITTVVFVIVSGLSALVIWRRSRAGLGAAMKAIKEPAVLAFGTGNSLVCVPSVVEALERLGFGRRDVGLVVPLGITMFRFGNITYFAVATLFVAQLYDVQLEGADLAFIILGSVLAGVATAGTSGVLTLIMLDIVLVPLELPLSGVLPLFIVLEPVMTPLRTIVNVVANCALAALWAERGKAAEVQTSS
jgi:proton glutamate symport protein